MNCEFCQKETSNPKFCSRSCSAKMTNKKYPKRKLEGNCKTCQKVISAHLTYCGKECQSHSYKNRKKRGPYAGNGSTNCPKCGVLKTEENSYKRTSRYKPQAYCKECINSDSIRRARVFKKDCVNYKGGKCEQCGYNKCQAALEFHHIDPSKKDFSIASQKSRKVSPKIYKELDKCVLLCSNCHKEEHYRLQKIKEEIKYAHKESNLELFDRSER